MGDYDVPVILQTELVTFRIVTLADVEFTYELRHSSRSNQLGAPPRSLDAQRRYLMNALTKTNEIYCIVEEVASNKPVGTVRLTELDDQSRMNWESLVIAHGVSALVGIEVILCVYEFCFTHLRRPLLGPWRVRRDNSNMIRIHRVMKIAETVSTGSDELWYAAHADTYFQRRSQWQLRGFAHIKVTENCGGTRL